MTAHEPALVGTGRDGMGEAPTYAAPTAAASAGRLCFGDDEAAQRRMRGQ